MIYTIIASAALVAGVSLFADMKIEHWEWSQKQRIYLIAACAWLCLWAGRRSPSILVHIGVAAVALAAMFQTIWSWHEHRQLGGTFTSLQIAGKISVILVSFYAICVMIAQMIG